jgi:hypothetical protein
LRIRVQDENFDAWILIFCLILELSSLQFRLYLVESIPRKEAFMPRSFVFVLLPLLMLLAACSGPGAPAVTPSAGTSELPSPVFTEQVPTPVITAEPVTPVVIGPVEAPTPEATLLPFEAAAFQDETLGFQFDYPAAWTLVDLGALGSRGSGLQLTEGDEVRMNVTVLQWDPVNDLDAFVATRRQAWDASGFEIQSEEDVTLSSGHRAARFLIQTPDGERALFFFTALTDRYLEMNGTGDLELVAQVTQTLRLRQPLEPSGDNLPFDCGPVTEVDETGWVVCNVIAGIRSRNLSALHGFMADPFAIGFWGSEGYSASPAEITTEMAQNRLPADPSTPMTFTTEQDEFPPLAGQPPETLFGPDLDVVQVVYSEGWGLDGEGSALLCFARDSAGRLSWHALVYSKGHFDK